MVALNTKVMPHTHSYTYLTNCSLPLDKISKCNEEMLLCGYCVRKACVQSIILNRTLKYLNIEYGLFTFMPCQTQNHRQIEVYSARGTVREPLHKHDPGN